MKKHLFGKQQNKKQPLQDYAEYKAIAEPNIDISQLKQGTEMVDHDMGISILLLTTSSDSSQETETKKNNLTPEEIILTELQVISFIDFEI